MRISDWSSDVCSSDLAALSLLPNERTGRPLGRYPLPAAVLIPGARRTSMAAGPPDAMGFAIDSSAASWRTNLLHTGTEAGYGARLENSPVPAMAHDQFRCAGSHPAPATTRRFAGPHRRTG